jgi:F-type H+-transporting ATPase subunit b
MRTLALLFTLALALPGTALAEDPPAESGGHGAPAGEAHGDGHGDAHGGHGVTHLDNWWSFDFGPGKTHKNGPFGFAILNFIILLWLVGKFGAKPFKAYLETRHSTIKKDLEEAAQVNAQARAKLEEIEAKLRNVDKEIAELKAAVARDAALEKDRIIKAAEEEAERIVKAADETMDRELRRAHRRLELEAVNAAMAAADKLIRKEVNDSDRRRLNEEYFAQLGQGGSN